MWDQLGESVALIFATQVLLVLWCALRATAELERKDEYRCTVRFAVTINLVCVLFLAARALVSIMGGF